MNEAIVEKMFVEVIGKIFSNKEQYKISVAIDRIRSKSNNLIYRVFFDNLFVMEVSYRDKHLWVKDGSKESFSLKITNGEGEIEQLLFINALIKKS